jgi:hypothetical protein
MIPHILALVGFEYIMNAPTIMINPMIIPTTPKRVTRVPPFVPPLAS